MSLTRCLGIVIGRIATDGSFSIDVFFFDGHYAKAIATKSVPNTARKVSFPETSISNSSMIKSDLYNIGRGHETPRSSLKSP